MSIVFFFNALTIVIGRRTCEKWFFFCIISFIHLFCLGIKQNTHILSNISCPWQGFAEFWKPDNYRFLSQKLELVVFHLPGSEFQQRHRLGGQRHSNPQPRGSRWFRLTAWPGNISVHYEAQGSHSWKLVLHSEYTIERIGRRWFLEKGVLTRSLVKTTTFNELRWPA